MKESRLSELEKRTARHDREIAAIRKLLLQGAKLLVKIGERAGETDKKLDRLIDSLGRGGGNGHSGKTK